MQYYARTEDIKALGDLIEQAKRVIEHAEQAIDSAENVVSWGGGRAADVAQGRYDSHVGWVRKLADDLNTAAKNLP